LSTNVDGLELTRGASPPLQDAIDSKVGQYWANISATGIATIPRVKAGEYRLTLYAEGTSFSLPARL
jgi:rhamnogalacturonan endolyase